MKIELSKNSFDFIVEDPDDLYLLYLLIEPGDLIYGWTVREFRTRKHEKGERKKIYIGLKVEILEYHAFRNSLRIRGTIIEAPEWFDGIIGSYHTIEIVRGLRYKVIKKEGTNINLVNTLLQLFGQSSIKVLLVSLSEDEVAFAIIRKFGIDILSTMSNKYLTGKSMYKSESRSEQLVKFVKDICKQIQRYVNQEQVNSIIFIGPSYVLTQVRNVISEELNSVSKELRFIETFEGGLAGIYEFQNSKINVIKELSNLHALTLVEEIFNRLSLGKSNVAIGFEEVEHALNQGAVEYLLILDELYKELGDKVREIVNKVIETGAKLVIIPIYTNAGDKLKGIGGIAALLRYEIEECS